MSKETDDAVNDFLKSKGFADLKVAGVGKQEGRVEQITLTMKRTIDDALLQRAMQANDAATSVLLWTLEIEHQLSLFLEDFLGEPVNETNNLNTLVLMLKTCRFDNDIYPVVNGFRKLRNKFAHEKDASLEKHKALVQAIFRCKVPSPTEDEVKMVFDGVAPRRVEDFPDLNRLAIYANCAITFLAVAAQIYVFPKPAKRIVVTTGSTPQ